MYHMELYNETTTFLHVWTSPSVSIIWIAKSGPTFYQIENYNNAKVNFPMSVYLYHRICVTHLVPRPFKRPGNETSHSYTFH